METVFDFVPVEDTPNVTQTTKCPAIIHENLHNNKNNTNTDNKKNNNNYNNNNNIIKINRNNNINNNNNKNVTTDIKTTIKTAAKIANSAPTHTNTTTTTNNYNTITTTNINSNTTTTANTTTNSNNTNETNTTNTGTTTTTTTTHTSYRIPNETQIEDITPMNFYEKTTKNRIIALATQKSSLGTKIRLERLPGTFLKDEVLHTSGDGVFKGVVVVGSKKKNLVKVSKPHAHVSLIIHAHKHSKEQVPVKEKRQMSLWFYRGVQGERQLASLFVKSLMKPECFPSDLLGFTKKVILLMREVGQLKRVELQSCAVEAQEEVEETAFIENFITVLTPAKYDYQYLPEVSVSRKTHICFRVMAAADAHVALSYMYGDTDRKTYEVVIGGRGNTTCAIKYGGRGAVKVESYTPNVLSREDYRHFWISWNDKTVKLGSGKEYDKNTLVMWADIPQQMQHRVHLISVSTGPPSPGTWEFVELIQVDEERKENRKDLMKRVVKGLVWWGKKEKIIQNLEEAFPMSLSMSEIMRHSTINIGKMAEIVMFLKQMTKERLVVETDRGYWMRAPFHLFEHKQDIIRNPILQSFLRNKEVTVGIITSLFIEKTAMDSMMDDNDFIIIETENKKHTVAYSIGSMGDKMAVCIKLPNFESCLDSKSSHVCALKTMLGHFKSIEHIMVVGVGGGVPSFEDADKHIRRGDVVLSCPRDSDGAIYVQVSAVLDDLGADPTGNSASYVTSCWNAEKHEALQKSIKIFAMKNYSWQRYLSCSRDKLTKYDHRFNRPAMKTDKTFYQEHKNLPILPMEHATKHRTTTRVHVGAVASGNTVSNDLFYRRIFAKKNSVGAFDVGLSHVMKAIFESRIKTENVTIVLGVSDYCNGYSTKSWQPYSSLVASAVCKAFIQTL